MNSKFLFLLSLFFLFGCTPKTEPTVASTQTPEKEPVATTAPVKEINELEIIDLTVGSGPQAKAGDKITVHYVGTLLDGTKFDSSRDRDSYFEFVLGQGSVISGWDEGLLGMQVGGVRQLIIPAHMAYGERATGSIPANSPLQFDVELFGINGADSTGQPLPIPGIDELEINDTVIGTGKTATTGSLVTVHYIGTLADGSVFDSSRTSNKPIKIVLGNGQVIPGWEIGIQGMQVGGTRILSIPPELAYGSQGYSDIIPPDATLTFAVELMDVDHIEVGSLEIEDIIVGEGAEALPNKQVTVHYTGTLEDGTVFDSSHTRNQPFSFVLGTGRVIKGWDQGVLGMHVGGTRKLTIPHNLAYGANGAGGVIPPYATLTFEITLLSVGE